MAARITHVDKPDRDSPVEAITRYGQSADNSTVNWFDREKFIDWLIANRTYAFVSEDGTSAVCDIKNHGNVRFLQTRADASQANNLLSLPGPGR